MFNDQIIRIKLKLAEAKKTDKRLKVFGADAHKYILGKPATQGEISQVEKKYSIQLPDCYKAFITEIGNGGISVEGAGAGPFYGIYPLGRNMDELIFDNAEKYLQQECTLYPGMTDVFWQTLNEELNSNNNISDDEYEKQLGRVFSGILPLGTQGCAYLHGIVLNGIYKGRVINLDIERQKPTFTFEKNFLDWYERWLDEIISGDLITDNAAWFGYNMGDTDAAILETYFNASNPETKEQCLNGLLAKQKIAPNTIQIIEEEYLQQTNHLKKPLLQVLTKYDYKRSKPYLLTLSETDLLTVVQFVFWYAKGNSSEWRQIIETNISKVNDEETFRLCTNLLKAAKSDYGHLIAPFTAHSNAQIRKAAFYTLGQLPEKKKYLDYFITGLHDSDNNVLLTSLQSLSGIKDKQLLPHYKQIAEKFPVEQNYILSNLKRVLAEFGLNVNSIKKIDNGKMKRKWYQWWG